MWCSFEWAAFLLCFPPPQCLLTAQMLAHPSIRLCCVEITARAQIEWMWMSASRQCQYSSTSSSAQTLTSHTVHCTDEMRLFFIRHNYVAAIILQIKLWRRGGKRPCGDGEPWEHMAVAYKNTFHIKSAIIFFSSFYFVSCLSICLLFLPSPFERASYMPGGNCMTSHMCLWWNDRLLGGLLWVYEMLRSVQPFCPIVWNIHRHSSK